MRVPLHIVEARRERLRELIRTDGFLPVAELAKRLGVSVVTARRDLATVACPRSSVWAPPCASTGPESWSTSAAV